MQLKSEISSKEMNLKIFKFSSLKYFKKKNEKAEINEVDQWHRIELQLDSEKRLMHLWKSDKLQSWHLRFIH